MAILLRLLSILASFFLLISPIYAAAADISILCQQQGTCKQLGTQQVPIFTEQNILPGQSFTRVLQVKNDNKLHTCQLHLRLTGTPGSRDNLLAEKLLVQVFHEGQLLLGSASVGSNSLNIQQLQTATFARYFWSLPAKSEADFDLIVTFDPQAGNKYQGKVARTDIAVAITCMQDDELPAAAETAVVLPQQNTQITEVPLSGCSSSVSRQAPHLNLTHSDSNRGSISFSWQPVADATEYWLEFGREKNSRQFIHRGITATHYTALGLDMKNDLFFRILPVADCAQGSYSNTIRVLGSRNKKTSVASEVSEPKKERILGAQAREVTVDITNSQLIENKKSSQIIRFRTLLLLFFSIFILFLVKWFFHLKNKGKKR